MHSTAEGRLVTKTPSATFPAKPLTLAATAHGEFTGEPSQTSAASTSVLYSLLLRSCGATRNSNSHGRESTDRAAHSRSASYGHSPRVTVELETLVGEALRNEVEKMFPYRGVLLEMTEREAGPVPSSSTPPPSATSACRSTSPQKDTALPAKRFRACVARVAADDGCTTDTATQSTAASTVASPLSTSTAPEATGATQRKKFTASTIVVKKRPPRRIADAEAAAAAAAAAGTATTAAASPSLTAPAPDTPAAAALSSLSAADDLAAAATKKRRVAVLTSSNMPAALVHLRTLLDDFVAAVEMCRVAVREQRGGSTAAWETSRGVEETRDVFATEDVAASHPHSRRRSSGPRRRGNPTVLVADVPTHNNGAQLISEMVSPCSMMEMLRLDHGGMPLTGRSLSVETPREATELSACGTEATDLPRGVVAIAYCIADHLHALFNPTLRLAELEEEVTARLDSAAYASSPFHARRARPCTARDDSRSVSPTSRTSYSAPPIAHPQTGRKAMAREAEVSAELLALKEAAHTYLWGRITALMRSISLNTQRDGSDSPNAGENSVVERTAETEEEEKAKVYVQLPFLLWLHAASGLATDVVRGCAELPAKPNSSSAPLSVLPTMTLSDLLPTVDTLARQLQRHQYERVQPTAETLLTANTFLAFTGVKMTDKAIMERLFPLQSGSAVSDALAFSTLQSTASLLAHEGGGDFVELSTATTATFNQLGTLASTTTASEAPLSIEEPVLALNAEATGSGRSFARGESDGKGGESPLRPLRGTRRSTHTASPPSGRETQLGHDHAAEASTVEMYMGWLRRKEDAAERVRRAPSWESAGRVEGRRASSTALVGLTSVPTRVFQGCAAEAGEGGERSGADLTGASESSDSRSSRSSSREQSVDSCVTQQQRQDGAFDLSLVMPSADLAPCLTRVERELHHARGALQFARKLGTLYATQDMNTLLPLLPTLVKDERPAPQFVNPLSARVESGSGVLRGSFDSWAASGSPNTFAGNASLSVPSGGGRSQQQQQQQQWVASPLTAPSAAGLPGGLPPLIVAPLPPPSERLSGIPAMLTSRRAVAAASTATLFPSILPPSMDRGLLMAHLNTCAAAMSSLGDQFFTSSARSLEVAFSLSMVLLSHVMGEAVLRGERAAEATAKLAETVPSVVMKAPPFGLAGAHAPPPTSKAAATAAAMDPPRPRPLSIDLTHVLGFGKAHGHYQHLSVCVRETLISVALSALQQKDVVITQELLQYIALDTAISHHYAQLEEQSRAPAVVSTAARAGGTTQRGEAAAAAVAGSTTPATIFKSRKNAKAPARQAGRWMASLQSTSASFVNVWFSSFAHLADTTKHLLKGDHSTPGPLKDAVWHLAGLAQYFLLTRARGYDMYGGRSHLSAAAQPGCPGDLSAMLSLLAQNRAGALRSGAAAGVVASPALQHFITSQLVDPAEKVLGVLVSFMESVAEALTADMDSGAAMERQQRDGVVFAEMLSEEDVTAAAAAGPTADASDYLGSACDSLSQMSSEVGGGGGGGVGGCGSAANRSEVQETQACWMELAVHYFLEIVDVLLDVSLYLPEKPMVLYQLAVGASSVPTFTSDYPDIMMTVGVFGPRSPPMTAADYLAPGVAAAEECARSSPLERFHAFLSRYTSLVLQSAVSRFSVEGMSLPAWMATTSGSPSNTPATTAIGDEAAPRTFLTSLLASVAASLTPVGLGDIALSSARPGTAAPQPPLTARSAGVPASARVEASSPSSAAAVVAAAPRSTMWWPKARFQRYPHLVRIIEHAQLLCLFLNTPTEEETVPRAPVLAFMERAANNAVRETPSCLLVSAVTALLNTSTGPCAQLLSVPYTCPPLTVEAGSYAASSSMPNTSRDRQVFHSPMEQPHGRYAAVSGSLPHRLVLSDRVLREVCGGLWIRVEVLQLLRLAAAPLDSDSFACFTKVAADVASRVRDKSMQAHYKAVAAMKPRAESVLPKTYASTYVRLLFLRYVQAFYADMQALGAAGHVASSTCTTTTTPTATAAAVASVSGAQDHASTGRADSAGSAGALHHGGAVRPPWAHHTDPNNGETTTRSVVSPRAAVLTRSPLQDLSRRLWTQYCYQLLWALRELCWHSAEAHETANNLSIASVYGRLLQMIGGRPNHEEAYDDGDDDDDEEEGEEDSVEDVALGAGQFDLGGAVLATIITFDRSLAPYCTTDGGKPEGFTDFESPSSSASEMDAVVSPLPLGKAAERSQKGRSRMRSPAPAGPDGVAQIAVNVSDLTTLHSLEQRHRNDRNSPIPCTGGDDVPMQHSASSVDAANTTVAPPSAVVLPQLSLTGLKPPLYFASSGDTAAAQEDDYFKEQSKQRQKAEALEERHRNVASVSVMDASSYISDAEEEGGGIFEGELEDFELSSGSPRSSPPTASLTAGHDPSQAPRRNRPTPSDNAQRDGSAEAAPRPPAFTIPKLSLGALGPPLYFTSAGDTGVFAEVTAANSPALGFHQTAASAAVRGGEGTPRLAKSADEAERPVLAGGAAEPTADKAKRATTPPPPPPVLPSVTTKTVDGLALPKLSFGALGPAMYFTSSGDTGGFVEAQSSAPPPPPATTTVGGLALPKLSFGALGPPMYFTSSGDTGGFVEAQNNQGAVAAQKAAPAFNRSESQLSTNTVRFRSGAAAHGAPPAASSPERGDTPAAVANRYRDFSSSDGDNASSLIGSSFGARAATHKDDDGDADSRSVFGSHPGSGSSLASSNVADGEVAPKPRLRTKRARHSPRLRVTPVVPPVVTMELVLSLCSIILQRESGMIQYGYTVSSLTQKRVLPGVSAAQRRWLNSGNKVASSHAPGVFSGAGVDAGHADHWRYTPQHSPSSFHVIQALHNYLKDVRNTFVVDLLEEWMLDEYATMERLRVEQFEVEYGPQRREGGRRRTLSLSSTLHSTFNTTTNDAASRYRSALSVGRFVLLRLLLPRAITHLDVPVNERRIGAGGYGSVTSGTVHAIGDAAAVLPAQWGRRGVHWRPTADAKAGGGTARSTSGSHRPGTRSPVTPDGALGGILDGLRAPWRVAAYRAAQAVCRCDVAVKHLALSAQGSESGNLPVCHAEVLAMYRVRGHPHIVPLLSFDNTKEEYILIMPNYALGSFRLWRQKHYPLGYAVLSLSSEATEPPSRKGGPMQPQRPSSPSTRCSSLFATCARSLLQVLEAVVFMHELHIRHGDIKCDNVLIDKADVSKDGKSDRSCLPLSVRLCDFGSCDTCDDDDIRNLKNDIMAGKARFMAGRWGVGRGTEAIQPPEVMSAKRRYTLFHRYMTTGAAAASSASPCPAPLERADRVPFISSILGPSLDQLGRTRGADSAEGEERAMTDRLRRAELSVDIWACGCLLYEMLTGRMLFGEARLGRLLVLAAADDDARHEPLSGWRPTGAVGARPSGKVGACAFEETAQPSSPLSTRQALDEWERRDLEAAVGKPVVDFLSCLLDLDPLQRPSAAEALYHWKEILMNMGLEL